MKKFVSILLALALTVSTTASAWAWENTKTEKKLVSSIICRAKEIIRGTGNALHMLDIAAAIDKIAGIAGLVPDFSESDLIGTWIVLQNGNSLELNQGGNGALHGEYNIDFMWEVDGDNLVLSTGEKFKLVKEDSKTFIDVDEYQIRFSRLMDISWYGTPDFSTSSFLERPCSIRALRRGW